MTREGSVALVNIEKFVLSLDFHWSMRGSESLKKLFWTELIRSTFRVTPCQNWRIMTPCQGKGANADEDLYDMGRC